MISKRLQTIASLIPPAKRMVDVGCDHGYVIIEAFQHYQVESAVALDNKSGPLSKAFDNIKGYDFFDRVNFILSDGLKNFYVAADCFVFAGIGGLKIVEIIKDGFQKLGEANIIVQANRHTAKVRTFLSNMQYVIKEERVVYEDDKYYEILLFEKTNTNIDYTKNEIEFGPILLKRREEAFLNKLRNDLRILQQIPHKTQSNLETQKRIEEILCISKKS